MKINTEYVSLRLRPETKKRLQKYAEQNQKHVSQAAREIIENKLNGVSNISKSNMEG